MRQIQSTALVVTIFSLGQLSSTTKGVFVVEAAATTATATRDDYLVVGLESIEPAYATFDGTMYAGMIPTEPIVDVDTADNPNNTSYKGKLMFWYFEPTAPTFDDTIVVWFNGGPGCSSLGGCLFEHCPVTVPLYRAGYRRKDTDPSELQFNPYAWTNATRMLYVEQPAGTGFSTGPFPDDETDVASDFYSFLQNFYTIFGDTARSKKLYFFGESYAGMYVPSIAHYIYKQNIKATEPIINLAGIGLGNGWIDASVQGPAVIDYAYWHGMIDSGTYKNLYNEWDNCQAGKAVEMGKAEFSGFHEFTIPDECGIMGAVLQAAGAGVVPWGRPNAYDVSTWDDYHMLDDPQGAIAMFYNDPEVQKKLHVEDVGSTWLECMEGAGRRRLAKTASGQASRRHGGGGCGRRRRRLDETDLLPGQILLAHDKPESVVPYIATLLDDAKIRVLVYNGDLDMTTNSQGSEMLLDSMVWKGASGWANASHYERGLWLPRTTETAGGYMKQYRNLEFLVVINSGHLVPYNRPKSSLELITRFLGEESFIDKPLPKFVIHKADGIRADNSPNLTTLTSGATEGGDETIRLEFSNAGGSVIPSVLIIVIVATVGFATGFFVSRKVSELKHKQQYRSLYV